MLMWNRDRDMSAPVMRVSPIQDSRQDSMREASQPLISTAPATALLRATRRKVETVSLDERSIANDVENNIVRLLREDRWCW